MMRTAVLIAFLALGFIGFMWLVWRLAGAESEVERLRIRLDGERRMTAAYNERLAELRAECAQLEIALAGDDTLMSEHRELKRKLAAIKEISYR